MDAAWMQKWFHGDGTPRLHAAPFIDEAWDIARTVAEIDKQLLSGEAVGAFAQLAGLAYRWGQNTAQNTTEEETLP